MHTTVETPQMKNQDDHLHLLSRSGAPHASTCGAQVVNTGNDRSRKQKNLTCSCILCSPRGANTVTSNPPPQFRHCWNNDLVARTSILGWVLIFKPGLMRTHRTDHQTRSRTCAWGLESCSPRQAWRQYVLTTQADGQSSVSWSHQETAK